MKLPMPSCAGVVRFISANLYDNPVVTKEFRTRMRGWKAFLVMGGYVLFLMVVALISFASYSAMWSYQSGGMLANQRIGYHLFGSLTWTQSILLALVIPALAARSLTGELEQRTIELLVLTRLSPGRVVIGKLLSGFLYSVILLMCSLPLAGMCVMFGGISPGEVATVYALMIGWSFLLTSVAVFWSALFNRTMIATMFSYAVGALFMIVMSILIGSVCYGFSRGGNTVPGFAAMIPGWAVYFGARDSVICGLHIQAAALAFIIQAVLGTLLLLVASTHVRYKNAERPLSVRLLLVGFTAAVYWMALGDKALIWSSSPTPTDLRNIAAYTILATMILLALFTPIFTTGPIRKKAGDSIFRYSLSLRKVFKSELGGSILFMTLWAGTLCAVIMVTIAWGAKVYGMPVPAPAQAAKVPPVSLASVALLPWLKLTILTVAVTAGLSALGVFSSAVANRRREASVLLGMMLLALFALYGGIVASYDDGHSSRHNPVWQLAALWPVTPVLTLTNNWDGSAPPLWWNPKQSWMVVSGMYCLLGIAALSGAARILKKRPGVREE